jgi:E3 ubiquitin-protein ligase SHPRH
VHPHVGEHNRRALGHKDAPLRTVNEVLDVMMDQTDNAIRTEQRQFLAFQLRRGQLLENSPRVKEALEIWDGAAREASRIVEECRVALRQEIAKIPDHEDTDRDITDVSYDEFEESDSEGKKKEESVSRSISNSALISYRITRLSVFRNRLRASLELEHVAVFFRSNAYFQIKSNEEMTKPDSPEFHELETQELDGYEVAKKLRREILKEVSPRMPPAEGPGLTQYFL